MIDIVKIDGIQSVYATGDLHGNFNGILGFVKRYDLKDCAIIFCGDIGMGFNKEDYYKQIFNKIKKELKKRNIHVLFGRGNHDNPLDFNSDKWKDTYIQTLRDYSIININGHFNILYVGGGISIDRSYRAVQTDINAYKYKRYHNCSWEEALKNCPQCYWEDEAPIYNENKLYEIKNDGVVINAVCSHTSPDFCVPITKEGIWEWIKNDDNLSEDLDMERETITKLYNKLIEDNHPLTYWCYGHFHFHNFEQIKDTKFYLLDMDRDGIMDSVEIYRKDKYGN